MTPLYGHTSAETAYVVTDYPYGSGLRCNKRFWLEFSPKHGWRFVGQTSNPKRPGLVWNKPHPSTYTKIAACMYLDDDGHVQWSGLSEYSSHHDVAEFVARFPGADLGTVRVWIARRIGYNQIRSTGNSLFTMNGKPVPMSADDIARAQAELDGWRSIVLPELASK